MKKKIKNSEEIAIKWKQGVAKIRRRMQINTNRKGSRFVDRVKALLEDRGYIVVKVSASKPFDLVAWEPGRCKPFLFECRSEGSIKQAFKDLEQKSKGILALRYVAKPYKSGVHFYVGSFLGHDLVEFEPLEGR